LSTSSSSSSPFFSPSFSDFVQANGSLFAALEELTVRGIIHRDISPTDVLLRRKGQKKRKGEQADGDGTREHLLPFKISLIDLGFAVVAGVEESFAGTVGIWPRRVLEMMKKKKYRIRYMPDDDMASLLHTLVVVQED
jgi:serine/threonine protein kinase